MNKIYKVIWSKVRNCYVELHQCELRRQSEPRTCGGGAFCSSGGNAAGRRVFRIAAGARCIGCAGDADAGCGWQVCCCDHCFNVFGNFCYDEYQQHARKKRAEVD